MTGSGREGYYVSCGSTKDFDLFRVSDMSEDHVLPSGDPADDRDDVAVTSADEYSDAERDEVAARLASLGYIDE